MRQIYINWLFDDNDCEQCGGNYAGGARVELEGETILHLEPVASCYGSDKDWSSDRVYEMILEKLGYSVSST